MHPLLLSAARQRTILATLAMRARQVVPTDELTEIVWDGRPPTSAHDTIRTYVMRLRRTLGEADGLRIVTRAPGYFIAATDAEVDANRFVALCRSGGRATQCGSWQQAREDLCRALELWRGEPFIDVPSEILRRDHVPRLQQWHLQALEWRIDAELQLGCHRQLVPELQGLIIDQPLHERFYAQMMSALSRSGRQAEALLVYARARRVLVDELGIEPGPQLRNAHQHILCGELETWTG